MGLAKASSTSIGSASLLFYDDKRIGFRDHHIPTPLFPLAPGTQRCPVWKPLPLFILTHPAFCLQADLFIVKLVELRKGSWFEGKHPNFAGIELGFATLAFLE